MQRGTYRQCRRGLNNWESLLRGSRSNLSSSSNPWMSQGAQVTNSSGHIDMAAYQMLGLRMTATWVQDVIACTEDLQRSEMQGGIASGVDHLEEVRNPQQRAIDWCYRAFDSRIYLTQISTQYQMWHTEFCGVLCAAGISYWVHANST
jgi:hypothetical protein